MIFETTCDKINIREIGSGKKSPTDVLYDWTYQHTVQVSFKGKRTQFQFFSYEKEMNEKELLAAFKYFIESGLYADQGYEEFCSSKWGVGPEIANSKAGREKYLEDFKATAKRRAQADRIGITPEIAYDIEDKFHVMFMRREL